MPMDIAMAKPAAVTTIFFFILPLQHVFKMKSIVFNFGSVLFSAALLEIAAMISFVNESGKGGASPKASKPAKSLMQLSTAIRQAEHAAR
ncbi:hypothetical protein [Paenibacillus oleatilyticus]|uniref:Uncharacterized protein n=1 Tax=Paenibacillus oleatilyticus TaxID=2594886 RepID=A0ABV4V0A0_9BACL